MYQQPDPTWLAVYMAMEGVTAVAYVFVFVWLAAKAVSFLVCLVSHDGGLSRKEQLHRHRLENLTACMSFAGAVTGIVMLVYGPADGSFRVVLPGNIVIENAGVPVIVLAAAMAVLWMVLNAKKSDGERAAEMCSAAARVQAADGSRFGVAGVFGRMSYGKAALITIVLMPFINIFAIPVGIFLAVKVARQDQVNFLPPG